MRPRCLLWGCLAMLVNHKQRLRLEEPSVPQSFRLEHLILRKYLISQIFLNPGRERERLAPHLAEAIISFLARMAFLLANDQRDADLHALKVPV